MHLPDRFLDDLRSRASLTDIAGRRVTWDSQKSNPGKGDMWAPCPFHQEKTPSFHVDERKGFYYCFGCHAKGDVVRFIRDTENASFMEAVESLARQVGLAMPERTPEARAEASRRDRLVDAHEEAARFFRLQLNSAAGTLARDYLARRGLSDDAVARWEIGFAPDSWDTLREHLKAKGFPADISLAAGLVRKSDKGGQPYDTFRNRITFPIRDRMGHAIAFGGRALGPFDPAKYLNSPETELFDKGRTLFNHQAARSTLGKGAPLIVAEGYMDVIALSEAGFAATVAPLGTAITEAQLQAIWSLDPEPAIALDGDDAGLRAAMRLVDLALPSLGPDRSLRFALMPSGQDPDDLIKSGGPAAMREALGRASSVVDMLWRRATEGKPLDSPERLAALDKALEAQVSRIRDGDLRRHYFRDLKDRKWQLRISGSGSRSARNARDARGGKYPARGRDAPSPLQSTTTSQLASSAVEAMDAEAAMRLRLVLATLLVTPVVAPDYDERVRTLACPDPWLEGARQQLLDALAEMDRQSAMTGSMPDPTNASISVSDAGASKQANAGIEPGKSSSEQGEQAQPVTGNVQGINANSSVRKDSAPEYQDAIRQKLVATIGEETASKLSGHPHVSLSPAIRKPGDALAARMALDDALEKLEALEGWRSEASEALEEFRRADLSPEDAERTLYRLTRAVGRFERSRQADPTEPASFATGPNGLPVLLSEREEFRKLLTDASASAGHRRSSTDSAPYPSPSTVAPS